MYAIIVIICALLLAGCAGVPESTLNSLANAGGGCVKSQGLWGSFVVMTGSADKGTIRNGEVTIAGDCSGITIKNATVPPVKP